MVLSAELHKEALMSEGSRLADIFGSLPSTDFKRRLAQLATELAVADGQSMSHQVSVLREALVFVLPYGLAYVLESCELSEPEALALKRRMAYWLASCAGHAEPSIKEVLDKAEAALLVTCNAGA